MSTKGLKAVCIFWACVAAGIAVCAGVIALFSAPVLVFLIIGGTAASLSFTIYDGWK